MLNIQDSPDNRYRMTGSMKIATKDEIKQYTIDHFMPDLILCDGVQDVQSSSINPRIFTFMG